MAEQIAPQALEIGNVSKVIVCNGLGQYLILRSSEWPERPDRSLQTDLPGGVVDEGESHRQGACRELLEETGIEISEEEFSPVFSDTFIVDNKKSINRMIFFVNVPSETSVTLSWEHCEYWWASAKELIADKWRPPYPSIFKYLIQIGAIEIES